MEIPTLHTPVFLPRANGAEAPADLDAAIAAASRRYELLRLIRDRRENIKSLHAQYCRAVELVADAECELAQLDEAGRAVK